MSRIHLFEFEDLKWFPKRIRNYGTDFLQFVTNKFDFYAGVVPLIEEGIAASETNQIIDLASGGGGGWKSLSQHLKKSNPALKVKLTDYYPNIPALKAMEEFDSEMFSFEKESVSALEVPSKLKGFRTQFLSFHHFDKGDARKILQNAIDQNQPIGIFEGQKRDVPHFIKNLFSPISIVLVTPFVRPFKFGRLFFTYILPIVPLFVLWDGLVSVLRTYSTTEMEALVLELKNSDQFTWKIGIQKNKGITVPYLLGIPKKD